MNYKTAFVTDIVAVVDWSAVRKALKLDSEPVDFTMSEVTYQLTELQRSLKHLKSQTAASSAKAC